MNDSTHDDWFLKDWLSFLGKRQSSLVNELGWTKNRASIVYNGQQPYKREVVNEIAAWLEIKPFELLMPPKEAVALRRLRENAAIITLGLENESQEPTHNLPGRKARRGP